MPAVDSGQDGTDRPDVGMETEPSHTEMQEGAIDRDDQLSRPGGLEGTTCPTSDTTTIAGTLSVNPWDDVDIIVGHEGVVDSSSSGCSNQPPLSTTKSDAFPLYKHAYSSLDLEMGWVPNLSDFQQSSYPKDLGLTSLTNDSHNTSSLVSLAETEDPTLSAKVAAAGLLSYLHCDSERETVAKIMAAENIGLRDIVKYGLVSLGSAMKPSRHPTGQPTDVLMAEIASACATYGVHFVLWTGVRRLAQMAPPNLQLGLGSPVGYARQADLTVARFDIYGNTITLAFDTYVSAAVANAQHLRIPIADLMNDCSVSPLTSKTGMWADSVNHQSDPPLSQAQGVIHSSPKVYYPDLEPTPLQLKIPHHPYLDVIPWPSFRTKAIIAASLNPPLIDEVDLCLDLCSGIRCWGSIRLLHGRGEGTPWDKRSWEAMPWFLEKWRVLLDGDHGEISRNSAWWRTQHGLP